jgi:hypothetical protein
VVPDYDSNMMNQCLRNFQLWIEPAEHHSQRPYSYLHNIDQQEVLRSRNFNKQR